jgi:hypothetical protein
MKKSLCAGLLSLMATMGMAQEQIPLNNLDSFTGGGSNWSIVGDASASLSKKNTLITTPGTGVLACTHEQGKYGMEYELFSKASYGDMDISFDFMMPQGANSGVYLQSRYEIQLYDSWGSVTPKYYDAGGIYERWDDSKPEGMKGYEGTAPRVSAAKAPGLWQHMAISFQAPRFDNNGKKTSNAKILKITLNGMTLHENVELTGPTRGAIEDNEVAIAPLRFQGDHGSLAFKNIVISNFDQKAATVSNIKFKANYDSYDPAVDPFKLAINDEGSLEMMTWEFLKQNNNFAYSLEADLNAPESGTYDFTLFSSGNNLLKIDGKDVIPNKYTGSNNERKASVQLSKGTHKLTFSNAKYDAWMQPTLGLFVSGPGFRSTLLSSPTAMLGSKMTDPILVNAPTNTTLRSFMDIAEKDNKNFRLVHAISIGSPSGIHYTYDMDKGAIAQVWRGGFLDATPMWDSRGDGSSRPLGVATILNHDLLFSKSSVSEWPKDTVGSNFKPKGYKLDENESPTFLYEIFGSKVEDKISVTDNKYFTRTLRIDSNPGLFVRLATGSKIEQIEPGLYAVDNKNYYIQLNSDTSVLLRKLSNSQELVVPISDAEFSYSILY